MKALVIGATGRVGKKLIEYLLEDGHTVNAYLRSPENLLTENERLSIFIGDVQNYEALSESMLKVDAVFSCLSGRETKPDYSILSKGIKNITEVMGDLKVKRILSVAGAGILNDREFGLRRNRPGYPEIFKNVSAENLKVRDFLETTDTNWTLVSCPEIPDGDRTGTYRTEIDYLPEGGSRISTGDVADFMIKNVGTKEYFRKRVGISY